MNLVKSALHNLSSSENMSKAGVIDYGQGLVVGLVSGLMHSGMSFDDAIAYVKANLPNDVDKARRTKRVVMSVFTDRKDK